jgi:hypothetical protein
MDIAEYNDKHMLYLNEEITIHCFMIILDIDNIYYIEDPKEKEKTIQQFNNNCVNLISMIRKETGLEKLDKFFTSITKAKHQSEIIDYYKELKEKYKKEGPEAIANKSE